jgi:cold shock protein
MNIKSTLAVLGPAFVLALVAEPLELTARLNPSYLLVLVVALLASLATVFIRNFTLPPRQPRPASTAKTPNKTGGNKETGAVKWFNASKGFGFITRGNGDEIFVHFRSIVGQRSLRDGQRVEFSVTTGSKGLQAEDVIALK